MEIFKQIIKKQFPKTELVKVYSHPRSGTHFLEAFIAKNFYKNKNLNIPTVIWGHWSNRSENLEGNPYGKLFGNHYFSDRNINAKPKIYIMRDGRAVAYSIWKTRNFLHKELEGISFSDFLKTKIDWYGSPGNKNEPIHTIMEHWYLHIKSWLELAEKDDNLLILRYENLIDRPYEQYEKIHLKFFKKMKKFKEDEIDTIEIPLGLLPNTGTKDEWKKVFSAEDLSLYYSIIPNNFRL